MLPSKLQLHELVYLSFKIVARENESDEKDVLPFDFNGVHIGERADLAVIDENKEDPKQFALKFRLVIENKQGKLAPYDVDVEVAGMFSIIPTMPVSERDEFVLINGAGVIYSAIRDQVLTLTSRSSRGPLMLPTVNFLDYKDRAKEMLKK